MKNTIIIVVVLVAIVGGILYWGRTERDEKENTPIALSSKPLSTPAPTAIVSTMPTLQPEIKAINQKVNITMETNMGSISFELDGTVAPLTVGNFVALAKTGFYDGTTFHRVINNPPFMIQGGDPLSKNPANRPMMGTGGPGYQFKDEFNANKLVRGSLAMANSGPNTNGSQFFVVTAEATPWLDGKHTNFGKVIAGMDVVDKIAKVKTDANDNPIDPVVINKITVSE